MGIIQIDRVVNDLDLKARLMGNGINDVTKKFKARSVIP
jgi:hypothetical protein